MLNLNICCAACISQTLMRSLLLCDKLGLVASDIVDRHVVGVTLAAMSPS